MEMAACGKNKTQCNASLTGCRRLVRAEHLSVNTCSMDPTTTQHEEEKIFDVFHGVISTKTDRRSRKGLALTVGGSQFDHVRHFVDSGRMRS